MRPHALARLRAWRARVHAVAKRGVLYHGHSTLRDVRAEALWTRALAAGHAWEASARLRPWLRRAGGRPLRLRATPRSIRRHPLLLDPGYRYRIPELTAREREALHKSAPWTLMPSPILELPGTGGRRLNAAVRVRSAGGGTAAELPLRLGQVWQHFDVEEGPAATPPSGVPSNQKSMLERIADGSLR